jgi:ABC-type glycerol-3-phosphate transport system substrate-binding protein
MSKFLSALIIGAFLAIIAGASSGISLTEISGAKTASSGEISISTNEFSEQSETLKAVVDEFLIKIRDT